MLALVQKAIAPKLLLFMIEPEARSANPFGAFVNRNHFGGVAAADRGAAGRLLIAASAHPPVSAARLAESIRQFLVSGAAFTALASFVIVVPAADAVAIGGRRPRRGGDHRLAAGPSAREIRAHQPAGASSAPARAADRRAVRRSRRLGDAVEQSFADVPAPFSRTTIWRESLPIMRDFWLTGTGAGTYSDAMTLYQQSRVWVGSMQRWAHFNNAHSHYLQVLSEGGLLLAVPALVALAAFAKLGLRAVHADKGEMFWVRVGAAAGLAGLAVQSIWEVALIMPANAVLAGVAGGLVLYQRDGRARPPLHPSLDAAADPRRRLTHAHRRPQRLSRRCGGRRAARRRAGRGPRRRTVRRIKHVAGFPAQAIARGLAMAGATPATWMSGRSRAAARAPAAQGVVRAHASARRRAVRINTATPPASATFPT